MSFNALLLPYLPLILGAVTVLFLNIHKFRKINFALSFLLPEQKQTRKVEWKIEDWLRTLIKIFLLLLLTIWLLDFHLVQETPTTILSNHTEVFLLDDSISSWENNNKALYLKELASYTSKYVSAEGPYFLVALSSPNQLQTYAHWNEAQQFLQNRKPILKDWTLSQNLSAAIDYLIFLKNNKKLGKPNQKVNLHLVSDFQRNQFSPDLLAKIKMEWGEKGTVHWQQWQNVPQKSNYYIKQVEVEKSTLEKGFELKLVYASNDPKLLGSHQVGYKQGSDINYLECNQERICQKLGVEFKPTEVIEFFLFAPQSSQTENASDEIIIDNYYFLAPESIKKIRIGILSYQGNDDYFESDEFYLLKALKIIDSNADISIFYESEKIQAQSFDLFILLHLDNLSEMAFEKVVAKLKDNPLLVLSPGMSDQSRMYLGKDMSQINEPLYWLEAFPFNRLVTVNPKMTLGESVAVGSKKIVFQAQQMKNLGQPGLVILQSLRDTPIISYYDLNGRRVVLPHFDLSRKTSDFAITPLFLPALKQLLILSQNTNGLIFNGKLSQQLFLNQSNFVNQLSDSARILEVGNEKIEVSRTPIEVYLNEIGARQWVLRNPLNQQQNWVTVYANYQSFESEYEFLNPTQFQMFKNNGLQVQAASLTDRTKNGNMLTDFQMSTLQYFILSSLILLLIAEILLDLKSLKQDRKGLV